MSGGDLVRLEFKTILEAVDLRCTIARGHNRCVLCTGRRRADNHLLPVMVKVGGGGWGDFGGGVCAPDKILAQLCMACLVVKFT